ncbi:MAG: helix-turn-helix domain-containing protein [Clostridia bacterium]|nr:helix-turn-helix domain-containing protein [Clostridia bacterium]
MLSDRIVIKVGLKEQKSFSAIADELGKDPTTISKEVRSRIKLKQAGR